MKKLNSKKFAHEMAKAIEKDAKRPERAERATIKEIRREAAAAGYDLSKKELRELRKQVRGFRPLASEASALWAISILVLYTASIEEVNKIGRKAAKAKAKAAKEVIVELQDKLGLEEMNQTLLRRTLGERDTEIARLRDEVMNLASAAAEDQATIEHVQSMLRQARDEAASEKMTADAQENTIADLEATVAQLRKEVQALRFPLTQFVGVVDEDHS